MSGIIKAGMLDRLAVVRSIDAPGEKLPDPQALEMAQLRDELARCADAVRVRDEELAKLNETHEQALADAFEQGKAAGREEAHDRQAERLALLTEAIDDARLELRQQFAAMERTAVSVACECLEKILGQNADRAHLMADLIRRQIAQVGRDTIVEVSVSQDDFASDEAVAEVDRNISIVRTELASGSCRIKLEMGEIDAGLPHQWAMLRNVLAQSGEEELRRAG